eukprot:6618712-Ditylum_brightwellii.AAC.1
MEGCIINRKNKDCGVNVLLDLGDSKYCGDLFHEFTASDDWATDNHDHIAGLGPDTVEVLAFF